MSLIYREYTNQNPPHKAAFDAFFALLCEALPPNEHRGYDAQRALFVEPDYRMILGAGSADSETEALLAVWEFAGFRYIEHFAVSAALRGQGIGVEMLRDYIARDARRVVLEVEHPDTALAARRIGFYRRGGLETSSFPYAQPPLNAGDGLLPLILMSSGGAMSDREAAAVRDTLYRVVYRYPAK